MSRYSLLTGATDFLGRFLLRDLLSHNERVAVIVDRTEQQSARERIETIVQGWEQAWQRNLPRPQCIEGCVTQPRLGLTGSDITWIKQNCRRMIHASASLVTHGDDQASEPWQTNVLGTSNMLEACERCSLSDLHFISSASVSGDRSGLVLESEFDTGQTFRNDYEASRFEAEAIVRSATSVDHVTVYRPSAITGDTLSGYTCSYTGIYEYLQHLAILLRAPTSVDVDELRMHSRVWQCVPVNWVSDVICQIMRIPAARDRTYHITSDELVTTSDLIEASGRFYDGVGGAMISDVIGRERSDDSFADDSFCTPQYDQTNTLRFASDIPCPTITRDVLYTYLKFAEANEWKAQDEHPARVSAWSDAIVTAARRDVIEAFIDGMATSSSRTLGLDVVGPGGGQWSLQRGPERLLSVLPGLPRRSNEVVTVTTYDLLRLFESPTSRAA